MFAKYHHIQDKMGFVQFLMYIPVQCSWYWAGTKHIPVLRLHKLVQQQTQLEY